MEGFDWKSFIEMAALGTPFSNYVVRGGVQWLKKLINPNTGEQLVQGNALWVASLIYGMIIGGGFMFVTNRPPEGDWYELTQYAAMLVVYGLIQGFLASGIYDSIKEETNKMIRSVVK